MLSEPGASRSGNSGLVSSAKRRYLKLVHRKIPVSGHRPRTRETKLVHDTHSQLWDVVRRSRGPFTHLCRAERGAQERKKDTFTCQNHRAPLPMLVREKGGFELPLIEIPYITHINARPFYFPDSLVSCAPLRPRATRSAWLEHGERKHWFLRLLLRALRGGPPGLRPPRPGPPREPP